MTTRMIITILVVRVNGYDTVNDISMILMMIMAMILVAVMVMIILMLII